MWFDIEDYLFGGLEGYTDEFYLEVIFFSAIVLLCSFLIIHFGICVNTFRKDVTDRVQILMTKKELLKQKSFARVTSFIWIVALFASIAALGIFLGSKAVTAWSGVLMIVVSACVFLIVATMLAARKKTLHKALFTFISLILVAVGIMQFGVIDIDFAVRLKHVLFFFFVLAVYIILDYALYLVLIDRLNNPLRFARGFYIDNPAEYVWTTEEQPKIRVLKPGTGKPVKIRRFNIYKINEPIYKVRKLTSPKTYYIFYVEDSRVLIADTPDSKTSTHIFYIPLHQIIQKDLTAC